MLSSWYYGIFISQGAKIGENAVIFHQVTIGSNTLKDSKGYGAPQIGNSVYIGVGAKIDDATVITETPGIIRHSSNRDNSFHSYS